MVAALDSIEWRRLGALVALVGLIASAVLLTPRLDVSAFEQLLLGGLAVALCASVAIPGNATVSIRLTAAAFLVAAALSTLFTYRFDLDVATTVSAALLAILGALLVETEPAELHWLVPGSALAVPVLLFGSWYGETAEVPNVAGFLAAGVAAVSVGQSLARFSRGERLEVPVSLCLAGAAIAFGAVAVSTDTIWLTIAILFICASLLLETDAPRTISRIHVDSASNIVTVVGLAGGSAAIALTVVAGAPFGWPIAGAVAAGLAGVCAVARESQLASSATSRLLLHAQRESRVDALTGVFNRRGIEERINEELTRSVRYQHPMSILLIDLDDFKSINDRFGHAQGDATLRQVAQTIETAIRSIDAAGRYGGEEFLVLLPETDVSGAFVVANRIRASVEATGIATVSIGVAERDEDFNLREQLVSAADQGLYSAKRNGKNRVELAP